MRYGRTALELIVAQVLILTAFLVVPVDLISSLGTVTAGVVSMALAGVVASVLYARHRGRIARGANRDMGHKLETLRQSAAA